MNFHWRRLINSRTGECFAYVRMNTRGGDLTVDPSAMHDSSRPQEWSRLTLICRLPMRWKRL